MEVNFRTNGTSVKVNVPVGGDLTFHINPVNGARVYPQASGGFTINVNPVDLLVPQAGGGVKDEYGSENPKLSDPSPGMANPKARKAWGSLVSHSITKDQSSTIWPPII
uniref:Uncharacterized protein n=1 Tax=Brassica oleracea TaxID=3712 RepID=A0A3P6A5N5_BRAOL|nr:unnamed protein product [Brassica oleracea]